ncbi:MAG: hypothetical protein ACFFCZ_31155 [Promethearchaeota archaeon]
MAKKRWYEPGVPPKERYVVSSKLRPQFTIQADRKRESASLNLIMRYGMPALLMLGLIGVKLLHTVFRLILMDSPLNPLTDSDNYLMIIGGFVLVLLLFGGAFIGITLKKSIGAVVCLLGVIIDIIVRFIALGELVSLYPSPSGLDIWNVCEFDFFDFFIISVFIIGAIFTIQAFRDNQKKLKRKKLCKNCGKFIADATPGFCPHCGHLIGSSSS